MEGFGARGEGEEGEGCRCTISGGDGPLEYLMQYWRDEGEVGIEVLRQYGLLLSSRVSNKSAGQISILLYLY